MGDLLRRLPMIQPPSRIDSTNKDVYFVLV